MEERQRMARLSRQEMEMRSQDVSGGAVSSSTPGNLTKKKKKKDAGSRAGAQPVHGAILLDPQLQKKRANSRVQPKRTHYTQGTFNSLRRQQPPVECAVSFSSPARAQSSALNGSVIRPCQVALSFTPAHDTRNKEVKRSTTSATSRTHNFKHKQNKLPPQDGGDLDDGSVLDACHTHGEVHEDDKPTVADLSSVIQHQNEQMTLLRSDIAEKLAELKADLGRNASNPHLKEKHVTLLVPDDSSPSSHTPGALTSKGPATNNVVGDGPTTSTVSLTEIPSETGSKVPCSVPTHVPVTAPKLRVSECSQMLKRLDELEAEENEIRSRWSSIVYEDLGSTKPSVTQYAGGAAPPPMTTPTCLARDREELDDYRERYSRYLDATGLSTRGGFSPWDMAER